MNGRTLIRVVLLLVIVVGAGALGVSAYNAGVTAGLAAGGEGSLAVAPVVYPYAGWGWHGGGFGFFGFLGFLFFLFLLFGLIRAATWGGRRAWGGGPGRWGGPGWGSPGRHGSDRWHEHEGLREIHRKLHETEAGEGDPERPT